MKNKILFYFHLFFLLPISQPIENKFQTLKMMSINNTGTPCKSIKVGYINLRAQSGFGSPKQAQVEHFVKLEKFDILRQKSSFPENKQSSIAIVYKCF